MIVTGGTITIGLLIPVPGAVSHWYASFNRGARCARPGWDPDDACGHSIGLGESEFGAAVVDGLGQCHGEPDFAAGLGDIVGFGVALG
ncbi:hypothetical protein [Nocardia sp. NPDC049707]|uniref:hypothetical protein n=1 Tax=Nocardia sp. NPDC049707 TaxID=3154735 RepID=UPI003443DB54